MICSFIILGVATMQSQDYFSKILDKQLRGNGQLMQKPATFSMSWTAVLDKKFYKLSFYNQQDGSSLKFKAIGFYKVLENNKVEGSWFDNRGITFPLHGYFDETSLTIFWGTADTEEGKTIYKLKEDGSLETLDFLKTQKGFVAFANAVYKGM